MTHNNISMIMSDKNIQKKKEIDCILNKYISKISALRKEQDLIIFDFFEELKNRQLDDIKKSLEKL